MNENKQMTIETARRIGDEAIQGVDKLRDRKELLEAIAMLHKRNIATETRLQVAQEYFAKVNERWGKIQRLFDLDKGE
jgi:hypothetical protein